MHVGHMVPFMALSWMYIHGYSATFLLGGATARIGDPEGRLTARQEVSRTTRNANVALMHTQLTRFGELMERYAERKGYKREWSWRRAMLNNATWHQKLSWSDLLRDMGQYVRLGPMLGRDSVKNRMEHGDGMSFAEFSYPLIQAWDWWHMFKTGVQVQIGGADQFGNILQGAEAVKATAKNNVEWLQKMDMELKSVQERAKVEVSEEPMGFTVPLLTTANGEKFGKSAGNAVWLDAGMTSVFELYAFWLKTADADVEKYLKLFTFLPLEEIGTIMSEHVKDESKRHAQHTLAFEFTTLVHGVDAANEASLQHHQLFKKDKTLSEILELTKKQSEGQQAPDGHPSTTKNAKPQGLEKYSTVQAELPRSVVMEKPLSHVLWSAELAASKSEAQRLINNKGAYIGAGSTGTSPMGDSLTYSAILDPGWNWWKKFIIDDNLLVLRTGKWRVKIINIVSDEDFKAKGLSCPGFGQEDSLGDGTDGLRDADGVSNESKRRPGRDKGSRSPYAVDSRFQRGWQDGSRARH
ncbi:tyrosine-tRNA ligase [Cyphellophora europaea CBS 101466]|uniref:Tyrosine--tRNA ligase n=1 Tax=Cyphellophora europaea (strain CBS 101466) TaxID=1220924 RepID=W2RS77_CYPE1|nr:tyrosine-tRNA ligase [Cyphellophora europaea CBS 101466]ETN38593.1 tyrosine-tRNA ligase [Cyphellophora europaea CBS 101466]